MSRSRLFDKNPKLCITMKLLLLAGLVSCVVLLGVLVWELVKHDPERKLDGAGMANFCEREYLEKDYGRLYERLCRYGLDTEYFQVYLEIAEAAVALENLKLWHRAEKKGLDGSPEKKEYYYNEVLSYAQNCKFERNKAELERFAAEATDIFEESHAPQ